jgi:hypothetical protein
VGIEMAAMPEGAAVVLGDAAGPVVCDDEGLVVDDTVGLVELPHAAATTARVAVVISAEIRVERMPRSPFLV